MKFNGAEFTFTHPAIPYKIVVRFGAREIWVRCGGKAHKIPNAPRKYGGAPYKPCLTHARSAAWEAIEALEGLPHAKTVHAKQRAEASRDQATTRPLRIFGKE